MMAASECLLPETNRIKTVKQMGRRRSTLKVDSSGYLHGIFPIDGSFFVLFNGGELFNGNSATFAFA